MHKKAHVLTLILALLFSTVGPLLVGLADANPMAQLPTITLNSDGTVEPQTTYIKQDGSVYTLTDDIAQTYSIRILCSNIVFDGQGHCIEGISALYGYSGIGLSVESVTNVTIKNVEVKGFSTPVDLSLEYTNNSTILNIKAGEVRLRNSDFNSISRINTSGLSIYDDSDHNTITECNFSAFYEGSSYNIFFKNNIFFQAPHFLLGKCQNFWDNGSVGNYWNNYNGADVNCDGLGDTPHIIKPYYNNASAQDRFPLMYSWDPAKPIDRTTPRIGIVLPQNMIYNDSSVALAFSVCEPVSWMGYSLNGQDNVTVTGNTTMSGLGNGAYNLTLYATDLAGNTAASETSNFTVSAPFPIVPVVAVFGLAIATSTVCLLFYKKRSTAKLKVQKRISS
jgi:hypothetical protein